MTKILHIAQSAGYGVTAYVEALIKALRNDSLCQELLGSEYYNQTKFRSIVDKLICIRMDRNITKNDFKTIIECRKIIRKEVPDIVYCHSAKAGIYGRIACFGTKTKVIYNPHGWAFNMRCSRLKKLFYGCVESFFSYFTDRIIAISDYEKESTPWYIPRKKVEVIKNGIDTKECMSILNANTLSRESVGIPKDAFVVGISARISIQKGQDMLVEIASRVKRKIPNAFFVIIGGKSDNVDIESLIEKNGLKDSFLITGEVDKAIRYVSLFDVAVLTSRWEGFGLVLLEYMLAEKPIVAFKVDAIPEVVEDKKSGILINPFDLEAFANAIVELHNDNILYSALVRNGMKRVTELFDINRVAKEHLQVIKELMTVNQGGGKPK